MNKLALCLVLVFLWPFASFASNPDYGTPDERLLTFLEWDWDERLGRDPLLATAVGSDLFADRLPKVSLEALDLEKRSKQVMLLRLDKLSRKQLSAERQVDYDIFRGKLEEEVADLEMGTYRIPISDRWGFHLYFLQLPDLMDPRSLEDYENYLSRLRGFRDYAAGHIELMREGLRTGWVSPRLVMEGAVKTVEPQVVETPEESLLWAPFEELPESFSAEERQRLLQEAREAITTSVIPGYRDFRDFLRDEYVPKARESIGASELPDGEAYYAQQVRKYTTLDITPREVHEIGLSEVQRIRAEMETVMQETGFEGDLAAFIDFLRTDPQFYPKSGEELMQRAALITKRMDGQLPKLFGKLPRTPYGLKEVPDYLAPNTYPAYYEQPAGDGSRAGFYYVNTYNLPSRPLYELEALSLHEAVPGHHLQLALQQELDLVPLRRFFSAASFVEGWALYSESLGLEVGFYTDPYSDFGRLTYEMWRACRLVVDTGIHAFGWSRQQAIDFMAENSALSLHNITTEVDRYIGWPGQALGYKLGELKIRELRSRAEEALGERFDVRAFHDLVLGSGAVPLRVLEDAVDRWIGGFGSVVDNKVQ
ncbi:MAG: DUF885 domain-containing protein [Acidobacteriota bacterium]|nr:DUF885 domain-containing protein [Acidobacteriota bacterium]